MHLSPELQQAIEQIAARQGISSDQFIIQTLVEKLDRLRLASAESSREPSGLRQKEGVWVFETEPLDAIDFHALLSQSREAGRWESLEA